MEVHYAEIALIKVNTTTGAVFDPNTSQASIKDRLKFDTQHRILKDTDNSNTNNFPDIRTYLQLEAASGFQPVQVGQSFVVTFKP